MMEDAPQYGTSRPKLRKSLVRRDICSGDMVPFGWGRAYYRDYESVTVCYPIPLNWLVGWVRSVAWYLARGPVDLVHRELRGKLSEVYRMGYADGLAAWKTAARDEKSRDGVNA